MTNQEEIFSDKIIEVGLINDMIRMDFVSIAIDDQHDENKPPKMIFKQRVIMPPEGFLQSFALMQDLIKKLESRGMVVRQDHQQAAQKPTTSEKAPEEQ